MNEKPIKKVIEDAISEHRVTTEIAPLIEHHFANISSGDIRNQAATTLHIKAFTEIYTRRRNNLSRQAIEFGGIKETLTSLQKMSDTSLDVESVSIHTDQFEYLLLLRQKDLYIVGLIYVATRENGTEPK